MKTALHTQLDSHRVKNNIKQVGLSLVEMMISALLSVVVIQGMFEVFSPIYKALVIVRLEHRHRLALSELWIC